MKNHLTAQANGVTKTAKMQKVIVPRLSNEAFYLMVLACQLKKLLGPASLQHFIATGDSVVFTKKAS